MLCCTEVWYMTADRFASWENLCMRSCSSWSNRHACTHLSSGKSTSLLAKPEPFPAISPYLRAIVAALCVCFFMACCLKIKNTHPPSSFIVPVVRCPHPSPGLCILPGYPSSLVTRLLPSKSVMYLGFVVRLEHKTCLCTFFFLFNNSLL